MRSFDLAEYASRIKRYDVTGAMEVIVARLNISREINFVCDVGGCNTPFNPDNITIRFQFLKRNYAAATQFFIEKNYGIKFRNSQHYFGCQARTKSIHDYFTNDR